MVLPVTIALGTTPIVLRNGFFCHHFLPIAPELLLGASKERCVAESDCVSKQ